MKLKNVKCGVRVKLKTDYPHANLFKGMTGTIKQDHDHFPYIEWDNYCDGYSGNDDDFDKTSYLCAQIEDLKM